MGRLGFIFSLDAFIAFTLIMVTIGFLVFTIGTPKPFYSPLEQAHQLAYDTLNVLSTSSDTLGNPTYLEQILSGGDKDTIMKKVAGGDSVNYPNAIIPQGYGYRLESYNFNTGSWSPFYDAGTYASNDRFGKRFTKVQASATTFASLYSTSPRNPGQSPYCYLSCFGYQSPGNYQLPCNATPCDMPISNFLPGNSSISLIRLVVYA
ncbi:MAG: hypothetical protein WC588_00475 [Candidatus Micrarchaeia archaeon]